MYMAYVECGLPDQCTIHGLRCFRVDSRVWNLWSGRPLAEVRARPPRCTRDACLLLCTHCMKHDATRSLSGRVAFVQSFYAELPPTRHYIFHFNLLSSQSGCIARSLRRICPRLTSPDAQFVHAYSQS